ncbi:predicted protein [Botrytis cinerea T4]|uniref:Uncharacterized protein n=1 Tax=Botryotinia fuckeliana (strain T4) TaxID=999810 RepID=G2YR07_BOTF4|nr:predicted protein [Botrytis cinerea T4]
MSMSKHYRPQVHRRLRSVSDLRIARGRVAGYLGRVTDHTK